MVGVGIAGSTLDSGGCNEGQRGEIKSVDPSRAEDEGIPR